MTIDVNHACDLVIFGTKGDLAKRKLLPALYKLEKYKKIHKNTRIIGAGRANWNIKDYVKIVKTAIKTFLHENINDDVWNKFQARLYFCNIDVHKKSDFLILKKILNKTKNTIIYYCAVPPNIFNSIFIGLGKSNLNSVPARIILEKPLGECFKTFQKINNQISKYFLESQIFRIDHYLGKESILNLIALRFSNLFFLNNWNNKVIDHVQITVSEEVGIEERWNYFDKIGQMRDMVQNHLLQILTIIAMKKPDHVTFDSIRNEKIKILRNLKSIDEKNININTVRGQYSSGVISGKLVPSYIQEQNANKDSVTETFVCIKIDILNKQWHGVPFYLRTGKRLTCKYSEIVIVFKNIPVHLFNHENYNLSENKLVIRLEPHESIKMYFFKKKPGLEHEYTLENNQMICEYFQKSKVKNPVESYERLLLNSMQGTQSLFVCYEEAKAAWKWVDPIINAWKKNESCTLQLYESGTLGPKAADLMMIRDHRIWHNSIKK